MFSRDMCCGNMPVTHLKLPFQNSSNAYELMKESLKRNYDRCFTMNALNCVVRLAKV